MKFKKSIKIFLICILTITIIIGGVFAYQKWSVETPKEETQTPKVIEEEPKEKVYKASFIATGDALIHDPIYLDAKKSDGTYDFTKALEYIKPIIKDYDLAFYNQETILGGASLGYSTYPRFNTPSEFGDAMLDAGFNIVALANNHSYDKGTQGILNSVEYWKKTDVVWHGMNATKEEQENTIIKEKNGITYTMLSYTTLNNGLPAPAGAEYLYNMYNKEQVEKDIKNVRDKVDILIVSMHWGVEYSSIISTEQMNIANHLSELDVDIIVGTHPHVLQPISRINNTIVMWSLGNFISSQRGTEKLTGALASLEITKTVEDNHTIIEIDNLEVELVYTYKTTGLKNYQVIPFSMMESKYLINYAESYESAKKIITSMDENITVKPMKKNS